MRPRQLQDLSGRVALVNGGLRGLGVQMAEVLGDGAEVAITARKADAWCRGAAARMPLRTWRR